MRCLLFLAALCCVVLSACGGPIAREDDKEVGREVASRQAAPAAPAPADDDEDDDEEDDGLLDGVADDDDDDEDDDADDEEDEDDEDDDDEDYDFERILGDFLGDDDDDDDDEEPASSPVEAVAAPVEAAAAPAQASVEEAAAAASEDAEGAESDAEAAEDVEPQPGQKEPASAETEVAASSAAAAAADDDDDEEDITDALDPEEDDDEEEDDDDDEEDDDDDDDDIIGRNVSAKHARALSEPVKKQASVPAIYIIKYNKFVDTILDKMNDILRQSYDPVSVKLQPIDASKKTTKPKKNKKKSKRKSSLKKKNTARGDVKEITTSTEAMTKLSEENTQVNEVKPEVPVEQTKVIESRAIKDKESTKAKPQVATRTTKKPPTKVTQKAKPKPPTKSTTKKPTTTKNKTKNTSAKSKPRAKGTLYGLSSLRRTGDVAVSIMTNHTTVKSNFAVGPLILRVEKVVGRGAKKEVKSATATTAEMTGKLSLRINNQGVATLHSIKVLQPKQVRVDSNHERTRELVWRRSARIAHLVSEKLLTASKPMFHYQAVVKQ